MAASSFERLQRVLDLEKRQNWRNRAVIGGIAVPVGESTPLSRDISAGAVEPFTWNYFTISAGTLSFT